MAYSSDVKNQVLQRIRNGEKIKDISKETGISIPTIYNWKNKEKNNNSKNEKTEKDVIQEEKDVSKRIKNYISTKRYVEAKELGKRFEANAPIQSQMVTIAIKEKDYKTAKEIGKRFEDCAPIQSQMVTIAIKEEDYKTAKEIGKRFEDCAPIQSQMVTIAIKEGDYKTAKEIGKKFKDYAPIQSQILINQDTPSIKELNILKTKIYCDKIDKYLIEEIEKSENLSDYQKTIILLSICEKRKLEKRAKQIVVTYNASSGAEKTTINKILDRIKNKKAGIFNLGMYDQILGWKFDEELLEQYRNEELKHKEEQKEKINEIRKKKEEKAKENKDEMKKETTTEIAVKTQKIRYEEKHPQAKKKIKQKDKNEEKSEKQTKKVSSDNSKKIKEINVFIKKAKELLYVNMQSKSATVQTNAIRRWDKLEILEERIFQNREDEAYIEKIYNKINSKNKEQKAEVER